MTEQTLQPLPVEKWIELFIFCRDALKKLNDEHDNKVKEFKAVMQVLQGRLQGFLDVSGVDTAQVKGVGTIYSTTRYTASLADPDLFMKFVIANNQFDLLDRKANAKAVKDYVGENNQLPPGCNLTALKTVGVRRASSKGDADE